VLKKNENKEKRKKRKFTDLIYSNGFIGVLTLSKREKKPIRALSLSSFFFLLKFACIVMNEGNVEMNEGKLSIIE
jgi:hypothetical protein